MSHTPGKTHTRAGSVYWKGIGGPAQSLFESGQDEQAEAEEQSENQRSQPQQPTDRNIKGLSVILAAEQSLDHARKVLAETMAANEINFLTFSERDHSYQGSQKEVLHCLQQLTYARTYWTMQMIEHSDEWREGTWFKYGVKDKITYRKGNYMLSVSTIDGGHPHEWKMDLVGGPTLQPLKHPSAETLKIALGAIAQRIRAYHGYLESNYRSSKRHRAHDDPERHKKRQDAEEYSLDVFGDLLACVGASMESNSAQAEGFTPVRELGAMFWSDLDPDFRATDKNSDVTYDPQKGYHSRFETGVETEGHVRVDVYWRKPARRKWGVHVELENSKTIDFINRVLPYVSDGWMEIVIKGFGRTFHMKLLPWQEPKTTYVQPFWMTADVNSWGARGSVDVQSIMAKTFHEFRDIPAEKWQIHMEEPYLISGKGSEIDAMVQSINSIEHDEREMLIEACEIWQDNLKSKDHSDATTMSEVWIDTLKDIRAYFSTDVNKKHGDRSVFFFHIKGFIFGVEMLSPSIPYINLQYDQPIRTLPPRGEQSASSIMPGDHPSRSRSASRGRHSGEVSPRQRRQGSTPPASRGGSRGRPPAPQAQSSGVPQAVFDQLEQIQRFMRALEEKQQHNTEKAPENQVDAIKLMEQRFKELEKNLEQQNRTQQNFSGESEITTSFNEANGSMLMEDPAGEWLVAVSENHPEQAPLEIHAWGMLDDFETRNGEPKEFTEDKAVVFYLDQQQAEMNGTLLYTTFKKRANFQTGRTDGNFALFPYAFEKDGYQTMQYGWLLQYLIDDADKKKEYKMDKVKNSTTLVHSAGEVWKANEHLISLDTRGQKRQYYTLHFKVQTDRGMVRRNRNWMTINKSNRVSVVYNFSNKEFELGRITNIEKRFDPQTLVDGVAGHKYWLQMFPEYRAMPQNDRSGVLPQKIDMEIESLTLVFRDTVQKTFDAMTFNFSIIDCKQPMYICYKQWEGKDIYLYLGPYFDDRDNRYTWGIKSTCGKDIDPIWIANLPYRWEYKDHSYSTNRSNLFACSLDDTSQSMWFWRWIDGHTCKDILHQDIWFTVPRDEVVDYKRIPNVPNMNIDNDPRKNELNGQYIPFSARSLNQIFPVKDGSMLHKVINTWKDLETDARYGKFGLFIYEKNFPGYLNRNVNRTGIPVDVHMAPFTIIMKHTHLVGRNAQENSHLQLVDVQGPVWVSQAGYYMICPHFDFKKDKKCWAIFYWDTKKAAYSIFATKMSDHLVSTEQYDRENQLSNDWTFYRRWDGIPLPQGLNDKLTVEMEYNPDVKRPVNAQGKSLRPNFYSLFKRMPDFSVEKTEASFMGKSSSLNMSSFFLGAKDDLKTPDSSEVLVGGGGVSEAQTQEDLQRQEREKVQRETARQREVEKAALKKSTANNPIGGVDVNSESDFPSLSTIHAAEENNKKTQASLETANAVVDSIEDLNLRPAVRGQVQQGAGKMGAINAMKREAITLAKTLIQQQDNQFIENYDPKSHALDTENDFREHIERTMQDLFTENRATFNDDESKYEKLKTAIIDICVKNFMLLLDQRKIVHEREKMRAEEMNRRLEEIRHNLENSASGDIQSMRSTDEIMSEEERQMEIEKKRNYVERQMEIEKQLLEESLEKSMKSVLLIPYPFQRQTPWTDIMDNYRHFLMEEPARKDKKKREHMQKIIRQNQLRENEMKAREEAERKEREERKRQKEDLLQKKALAQEEFANKFKDQEPEQGSEDYEMLLHCRVFKDSSNWRKVPLELNGVNIGDTYYNFELISPYKMHYVAKTKTNYAQLVLMPDTIQNDKNESVYAWKLMLMKDKKLIEDGNPAPKVTVAVKWQQPEVLIDEYDNAWRWRFQNIPNIKLTNTDIIRELAEAEGHINYVWYKGMQFTKTQEILKDDLLPTFTLQHSGMHSTTVEAYLYSNSLHTAINSERFWASVWPSSDLRRNCLSFFEVPVYLYVTLAQGKEPQLFQLNSLKDNDTTVPRMQKNTPYDFTDQFYWYNTTNRSYFAMKIYADDSLKDWVLAVEKDDEDIPVLTKMDKVLCNAQNRWKKADDEKLLTKKKIQDDFWKYINFQGESNLTVKTTQSQRTTLRVPRDKDGTCVRYWAFHMFNDIEGQSKPKYIRENAGDFDFQRAAAALQAGWQSDAEEDLDLHPDDRFTARAPVRSSAASSRAAWSSGPSSQTTELEVQLLPLQSRRQSAALKLTAQRAAALKLTAQPCPKSLAPERPLLVNRFSL